MWGMVAQCLERTADDRVVAGSSPAGAASQFGQVYLTHIACVFSDETLYAVVPFYLLSMPKEVKDRTQGVNV